MRESIAILEQLANAHPDYPSYRLLEGLHELNLGSILSDRRDNPEEAEQLARRGTKRIEDIGLRLPAVAEIRQYHPKALDILAGILANLDKKDEARKLRQEAERQMRQLVHDFPDIPDVKAALADILTNRGNQFVGGGDLAAAEKGLRGSSRLRACAAIASGSANLTSDVPAYASRARFVFRSILTPVAHSPPADSSHR